jgi:hypothetical protein
MPTDLEPVLARQMEVYAGFLGCLECWYRCVLASGGSGEGLRLTLSR